MRPGPPSGDPYSRCTGRRFPARRCRLQSSPMAPTSPDKGKGAVGGSSSPGPTGRPEGGSRHRLRRADGSFVSDPPLDSDPPQKRQRMADGTEEAGSRAYGAEVHQSSTTTIIRPAATATATTIRLATATPGAEAASIAASTA